MNLQTALIALGILLVAGIYLFSRWQEGRGGKAQSRIRRARSEMSEPSFGRDDPSLDDRIGGDIDADLEGAQLSDMEEPAPPPDWDALEREMAQPRDSARETAPSAPPPDSAVPPTSVREQEPDTAATGSDEQDQQVVAAAEDTPPEPLADAAADRETAVETEASADDDIPILELRVDESVADSVDSDAGQLDEPADESTHEQPDREAGELSSAPVVDNPPATEPDTEDSSGDEPPALSPVEHDELVDPEMPEEDGDLDMRDERPSLGSFLGSLKPINKLRHSIQSRLDAVKAERDEHPDEGRESVADQAASPASRSSGQVDLLDLTRSSDPAGDTGDKAGPSMTEETPDTPAESSSEDEQSDVAHRARQAPSLGASIQDDDLHPAPGFDKLSQIDYYVKLSGERDVSRDSVLAVYREAAAGLSKSHSVYGLRLPDKVWRDLEHEPEESRFGDLVITVQLADNTGPVSEQEMTRFSNLVVKLSESTGRGFSFMAPIENAHRQALAIDRLRRKFDSIFVVNIKPVEDDYFDGAMIDRCASQIGLTPDDNKFYARYKPVGKQKVCLYSMANMTENGEFDIGNMRGTRTRGVTFFTRPAVNRSPGAVFSEMVDAAKAFASRVKGEPIAPGYDDLSNDDIEAIRRSIEKVAREMESYGIVPGSEEASRLF